MSEISRHAEEAAGTIARREGTWEGTEFHRASNEFRERVAEQLSPIIQSAIDAALAEAGPKYVKAGMEAAEQECIDIGPWGSSERACGKQCVDAIRALDPAKIADEVEL